MIIKAHITIIFCTTTKCYNTCTMTESITSEKLAVYKLSDASAGPLLHVSWDQHSSSIQMHGIHIPSRCEIASYI